MKPPGACGVVPAGAPSRSPLRCGSVCLSGAAPSAGVGLSVPGVVADGLLEGVFSVGDGVGLDVGEAGGVGDAGGEGTIASAWD